MKMGDPTLDQLRIFIAVVEEGSFGGAARRMGRAVSAISYGIAQMEAQLAVTLFQRQGSRKPVLTKDGAALLPEVRIIADALDGLAAKAGNLHEGLESNLSIVVDVMVPGDAIAAVLGKFNRKFPTVSLRLQVEALGAVAACLLSGEASLAIGGPVLGDHPDLERSALGEVELVPVAAPSHALAQAHIDPGEARKHLQLVLSDRSALTEGREFSVLSPKTWRLADLGAKHSLLREGIGWGNMPRHAVAADLAAGTLTQLTLPEAPGAQYRLNALWRRNARPGPASTWMIEAMRGQLA